MRIDPLDLAMPEPGQRVATLLSPHSDQLQAGDVVVIDSIVVSVAEQRGAAVESPQQKAAIVERESQRVLRQLGDLTLSETAHGFVMEDGGITWPESYPGDAFLLPEQPDRSAHKVHDGVLAEHGIDVAVVIAHWLVDPWRAGRRYGAIGVAGLRALDSNIAIVDAVAASASLVMQEHRAAIVREVPDALRGNGSVRTDLLRSVSGQLFR